MIKVTYEQLASPQFEAIASRLRNAPMDMQIAYELSKIFHHWKILRKDSAEEYKKEVIAKYSEVDEKGNPITDPESPMSFKMKEGVTEEILNQAHKEFAGKTVEIPRNPIAREAIQHVKVTPNDMEILELILAPVPAGEKL